MPVHRFIAAHPHGKHFEKTACGIELEEPFGGGSWQAVDGRVVEVTGKGEPFDCPRCRRVLELLHGSR